MSLRMPRTVYAGLLSRPGHHEYMGASYDTSGGRQQLTDHYQQTASVEDCFVNMIANAQDIVGDYCLLFQQQCGTGIHRILYR